MNAEQIKDFISGDDEYSFYGIRVHPTALAVGDVVPASYVWVDGTATDDQLPGACVVAIGDVYMATRIAKRYRGHAYLVASNTTAHRDIDRNDDGEDILVDAVVIGEVVL